MKKGKKTAQAYFETEIRKRMDAVIDGKPLELPQNYHALFAKDGSPWLDSIRIAREIQTEYYEGGTTVDALYKAIESRSPLSAGAVCALIGLLRIEASLAVEISEAESKAAIASGNAKRKGKIWRQAATEQYKDPKMNQSASILAFCGCIADTDLIASTGERERAPSFTTVYRFMLKAKKDGMI